MIRFQRNLRFYRGTLFKVQLNSILEVKKLSIDQLLNNHKGWANDVTILSDKHVVSCGNDCSIKLNNSLLYQHSDYVKCCQKFDGVNILSAGLDKIVKKFDVEKQINSSVLNTSDSIYSLATNYATLAVGTSGSKLHIYDTKSNSTISLLTQNNSKTVVSSIKFLDQKNFLSTDSTGLVKLWSLGYEKSISSVQLESGITATETLSDRIYFGLFDGRVLSCGKDLDNIQMFDETEVSEFSISSMTGIDDVIYTVSSTSSDLKFFNPGGNKTQQLSTAVGGDPVIKNIKTMNDKQNYAVLYSNGRFQIKNVLTNKTKIDVPNCQDFEGFVAKYRVFF